MSTEAVFFKAPASTSDAVMDLDVTMQLSNTPASAEVYRGVRSRMQALREMQKYRKGQTTSETIIPTIPAEKLRLLHVQYPSCSTTASRLIDMNDDEVTEQAKQARTWLLGVLAYHGDCFKREHEMRMFRSAIEKEMGGRSDEWTDLERLYMVLTAPSSSSVCERLEATFTLVVHLNFAERLREAREQIGILSNKNEYTAEIDADVVDIHEGIYQKARSLEVDHFACAVPLWEIRKTNASVIDDNAGCCPICHNSYTDFSSFTAAELLADYPVRIKYCGHIVGKGCLEKWMNTPKIAEARYPHRTCPLCRVKIEDEEAPNVPKRLLQHFRTDRRAIDTMRELVYGWGLETSECIEAATKVMSESIAVEQLLTELEDEEWDEKEPEKYEDAEDYLATSLEGLHREKFVWGFRGARIWEQVRDEWMNSGVLRKE